MPCSLPHTDPQVRRGLKDLYQKDQKDLSQVDCYLAIRIKLIEHLAAPVFSPRDTKLSKIIGLLPRRSCHFSEGDLHQDLALYHLPVFNNNNCSCNINYHMPGSVLCALHAFMTL